MKEKLKKAKKFVYDHKEEIAFTAIQAEDLKIIYQGKMRGANYTVSGCFASDNLITLKELCKDASNFSGVVDEDTPVVAYSILFKV